MRKIFLISKLDLLFWIKPNGLNLLILFVAHMVSQKRNALLFIHLKVFLLGTEIVSLIILRINIKSNYRCRKKSLKVELNSTRSRCLRECDWKLLVKHLVKKLKLICKRSRKKISPSKLMTVSTQKNGKMEFHFM